MPTWTASLLTIPFLAATLLLAACGAAADLAVEDPIDADEPVTTAADADPDGDSSDADTTDGGGDSPEVGHPVISFAAHGPSEANTFGPQCSMGIETTLSGLIRVTAPGTWEQRGSGGGTGASEIRFEVDGVEVDVDMASTDQEITSIGDVEFGATVDEADLDGSMVPVVEATVGDSTGYAIERVVWMTGLPEQYGAEEVMTVVVSSPDPAVPTLDDATAVLSSVRVERCAAIGAALVAASADRVLAVPEFLDDPLAKTYPDGDQPALDLAAAVDLWSIEQLAYLLPFPEPVARCVAESLKGELPKVFPLGMTVVIAGEGDQQDALLALADAC